MEDKNNSKSSASKNTRDESEASNLKGTVIDNQNVTATPSRRLSLFRGTINTRTNSRGELQIQTTNSSGNSVVTPTTASQGGLPSSSNNKKASPRNASVGKQGSEDYFTNNPKRGRSQSLTKIISNNLKNNESQYLSREKAYLNKISNQFADDYYTKGINDSYDEVRDIEYHIPDEDDDYDEDSNLNDENDMLSDLADQKLVIDDRVLSSLASRPETPVSFGDSYNRKATRENWEDPDVIERLEWQSMLTSVLTGDVVRSEKTKIINKNNPDSGHSFLVHTRFKENLWWEIKAKIFNQTEDDQRKVIQYRRTLADSLFDEVLKYEINYDNPVSNPPRNQVINILDRYDKCCELWSTLEDMKNEKPICRTPEFEQRIDALNSWLSITDAIKRESQCLGLWVVNDDVDINQSPLNTSRLDFISSAPKMVWQLFDEDNKYLAERLMKEKDVYTIFRKRIFSPLAIWMTKSKFTYILYGQIFKEMKLPDYIYDVIDICLIPMKLIREIIKVRLLYARKLHNPTLMMIDQMLDDFKSYITLALEVKHGILEYCRTDSQKKWVLGDLFSGENLDFDKVVLDCVKYYLYLLNMKILDSSKLKTGFKTFKEPQELEDSWNFLKCLGEFIEGGSLLVAEEISVLTLKLLKRLLAFSLHTTRYPRNSFPSTSDMTLWYTSKLYDIGQIRRKLTRFSLGLHRNFTNSYLLEILPNNSGKDLFEALRLTNHVLVYTGTVENKGMYFFASPNLIDNDQAVSKLFFDFTINTDNKSENTNFNFLLNMLESEEQIVGQPFSRSDTTDENSDTLYLLAICPLSPIMWEGLVMHIEINDMPITEVNPNEILLVTNLPDYEQYLARDMFFENLNQFPSGGLLRVAERRCSVSKIHHELTKINNLFFRMSLAVINSVDVLRSKFKDNFPNIECQELINNYFVDARDYGLHSTRILRSSKKTAVLKKLMQLAINWVSFVSDDCIPSDRKTFRACVLALEFAMDMTRGFNVLVLSSDHFCTLKLKVARCMSLLISHFDIMGARSSEVQKSKLIKWSSQRQKIDRTADEEYMKAYREDVMREIEEIESYREQLQSRSQIIGRVIDITDLEYQFVTLLASSFSSVSIRWQKGKYIGGGTFGSVYAAINLDTGGVMAVKEIKFQDSQSVKNLVPAIKDEMTILEMLNHPNVVQYFGIEVHRHKVYIFMEYCEGGSLASLLTHGRIEDEMVIQVYALQMLEGLAYLHQSGVAHCDIKPENILLDHNGVIKFVDFGAAKVIATSRKTFGSSNSGSLPNAGVNKLNSMAGTPMYMSPEVITGSPIKKNGVVDIWSLGCCVLEMATGRRPWSNLDNEWAIMYHIAAGHQPQLPSPDQLSLAGRNFVTRCLEHDPAKRPGAVELLSDPWIVLIRQAAFSISDTSSTTLEQTSEVNLQ